MELYIKNDIRGGVTRGLMGVYRGCVYNYSYTPVIVKRVYRFVSVMLRNAENYEILTRLPGLKFTRSPCALYSKYVIIRG